MCYNKCRLFSLDCSLAGSILFITFLGKNMSLGLDHFPTPPQEKRRNKVLVVYLFSQSQVSLMVSYFCRENDFEDGNHFYRFLEHEPFIPKCFNFRGSINDSEPKPATMIAQRLTKIMTAILESYASDDRRHVDYKAISNSEEFRRYAQCSSWIYFIPSIISFYSPILNKLCSN